MSKLFDNCQLVSAILPVDSQSAANNGDFVSLKNYSKCAIVIHKAVGVAGDDPTATVTQATTVAGAGEKALNFTAIRVKQGADLAAIGTFTNTTQSAANTYTSLTSAEAACLWVIEINASDLDTANNFDCLRLCIPDTGAGGAQLLSALYILSGPRFSGATMPSAIA